MPMTLARSMVQKSRRMKCRLGLNKNGRSPSDAKQNRSETFMDTLISRKAILPHRNAVPHREPAKAKAITAVTRQPDRDDSCSGNLLRISSPGKSLQRLPGPGVPKN